LLRLSRHVVAVLDFILLSFAEALEMLLKATSGFNTATDA